MQLLAELQGAQNQILQRKAVQDLVSDMPLVEGMGRSGRLRIAQLLVGDAAWGDVTLEGLKARGLGGRETAIVKLAEQWAEVHGHHVECFVPVERPHSIDYKSGGRIEWLPWKAAQVYLNTSDYDALVSWEYPQAATWNGVSGRIPVLVGMQVAHIFTEQEYDASTAGYVVLSRWAGDFLVEQSGGIVSWDKMHVVPNGVDLSRYGKQTVDANRRNLNKFFYSSSPDRGLHHLLRLWPKFRNEVAPNAELHVAYGVERWTEGTKWSHSAQGDVALEINHLLKSTPGVFNRGSLSQAVLSSLQKSSALLPYTADTMQQTETGCITITEAMAAGCPVITTDCDCIPSEYGHAARIVSLPFSEDRFLQEMHNVLVDPDLYTGLQEAGYRTAEERQWSVTASRWLSIIKTVATEKKSLSSMAS